MDRPRTMDVSLDSTGWVEGHFQVELDTRMDDTALNTIQLHCAYHLEGVPDDLDAG